jgi:UDP-N-acetylglucosamine:LPS N-acetylglucosamine transferase
MLSSRTLVSGDRGAAIAIAVFVLPRVVGRRAPEPAHRALRALLADRCVTFAHGPTNRSVLRLFQNLVLASRLMRRYRPSTLVTTGAGLAVPFCYVARLVGCRVIYVECLSRVSEPSLTGRLVEPVAHEFFVQWPQLVARYHRARYVGTVY